MRINGKKIEGVKPVKIEEKGLQVDKTLGLQPIVKITDMETGKEVK